MTAVPPGIGDLLAPRCGCGDCESAVSPGAYLATLLDYALKHVQNGDEPIDLGYLSDRLHQPLGGLPLDCEAAETSVAQPRIAVEALRGYVGTRPLLGVGREAGLVAGEAVYRLAAYTALLAAAGTSYEEVRRVRSAAPEERLALAERIGLPLTAPAGGAPRDDELDQLFLDPEAPATDPVGLTELALERMFGLATTTGDPLALGAKTGDATRQLALHGRGSWSQHRPRRSGPPRGPPERERLRRLGLRRRRPDRACGGRRTNHTRRPGPACAPRGKRPRRSARARLHR